jgi:hypothetical protein
LKFRKSSVARGEMHRFRQEQIYCYAFGQRNSNTGFALIVADEPNVDAVMFLSIGMAMSFGSIEDLEYG